MQKKISYRKLRLLSMILGLLANAIRLATAILGLALVITKLIP